MKVYITRRGRPDFIVDAETVADAIVAYWMASCEIPRTQYRVHFGRRRQSRVVSSAVAYWRLSLDLRGPLYDVLEETSTESQFTAFCNVAVEAAELLGK